MVKTAQLNAAQLAAHFINFAISRDFENIEWLTDAERQIIVLILEAAGFEDLAAVTFGKLHGMRSNECNEENRAFTINTVCPLKVLARDGEPNEVATAWLNRVFISVNLGLNHRCERDMLIDALRIEIEREHRIIAVG